MGSGDDVVADHFAHLPGRFDAGLHCGLHRGDIARKADGDQSGTNRLETDDLDAGRFGRGVGRFDDADQASSFDKAYGRL